MRAIIILSFVVLLAACSQSEHEDLNAYMASVKAKPAGRIDPIPTFNPYKPFDYSATMLRGPFDRPVVVKNALDLLPESNVKPDPDRAKEFLEQFNIESLTMVGTLEQKGQLWALLRDADGSVHYVKNGNYVGKHHGKIVKTAENYIQVVEIVANGKGWVERPRTLELREQ